MKPSNKEIRKLLIKIKNNHIKGHITILRGLCSAVCTMKSKGLITQKEENNLLIYIKDNSPWKCRIKRMFFPRLLSDDEFVGYHWEIGLEKPRLNWLKKHIRKLN